MLDRTGDDPLGPRVRCALHVEEVAGHAVRVALHHHRPAGDVRDQRLGDAQVVAEQVALRQPQPREVDFAQVGQRHPAPVDLDGYVVYVGGYLNRRTALFRTLLHEVRYTRRGVEHPSLNPRPPALRRPDRSRLAQLVEQLTVNQRVVGSSPTPGAIPKALQNITFCGVFHLRLDPSRAPLRRRLRPRAVGFISLSSPKRWRFPTRSLKSGVWIQAWDNASVIRQMRITSARVEIGRSRIKQTLTPTAPTPYLDKAVYKMGLNAANTGVNQISKLPVNTQGNYVRTGLSVSS